MTHVRMRLRLRLQLGLALMSCGMAWLVWQGATLDPPAADHPQAFYLGWPLIARALCWLAAGIAGMVCVWVGTRRSVDVGYYFLTVMPTQRAAGWLWESAVSTGHCAANAWKGSVSAISESRWGDVPGVLFDILTSGHCYAAVSTGIIALFWAALIAVVLASAAVPIYVGSGRH